MNNIVFFGASVTQQKTGYVHKFNLLINNNFTSYIIRRHGYGSMHLYDAGVCFINDIIDEIPNFCFIDWFSTGFITTDINTLSYYLDCIVRKLLLVKCKICFLLFDRNNMNDDRLKMYTNIITYARKYNIDYIEIYNNNVSDLLKDDVHTTCVGSEFYANKIYNYFIENMINHKFDSLTNIIPLENKLFNIRKLCLNKIVKNNIIFKGNFKIMGIYQTIGPFSGLCEVITNNNTINNKKVEVVNMWDQWCHYERKNIKLNTRETNNLQIKILQDDFDSSSCSNKEICFNNITKYMDIETIYYLGELIIDSIDEGILF